MMGKKKIKNSTQKYIDHDKSDAPGRFSQKSIVPKCHSVATLEDGGWTNGE